MKNKFILIIISFIITHNCGPVRYRNTEHLKIIYSNKTYYDTNQFFDITFACDQWYYTPQILNGDTLSEDDCNKLVDKKINIIGEDQKSYIGYFSDNLLIFSPRNFVNNRISTDKIIYQVCKNVLYTYTNSENFKNSNKFLRSTYYPNEFTGYCFELHSNLHFIKKEFQVNEQEYIFNIRSSLVYLTFNNKFEPDKNLRYILKVLGWKEYLSTNGTAKYPHYLALQLE
ncbi:hypothetical protein EHQ94_01875 [Leptospira meyeri]|uniref:hypothetical protein n=1 Tax=Leptospira meyeri TaxID=29508 RepID=UPI0010847B90|nr:hypothetical protein [Leptospira meyeri]TGM62947.1 hypothetical protein EHQ93_11575 [Leptospira meyeri]TGM73537.1 hypothetical protein EHQ94_01875 [Leptospira meyeri]